MGWGSEFPEPSEAFRHVSILNVRHAGTNLGVGLREPWGFAGLLCVFPRASCTLRFFADARTVQPRVYTLMEEMRPRRFTARYHQTCLYLGTPLRLFLAGTENNVLQRPEVVADLSTFLTPGPAAYRASDGGWESLQPVPLCRNMVIRRFNVIFWTPILPHFILFSLPSCSLRFQAHPHRCSRPAECGGPSSQFPVHQANMPLNTYPRTFPSESRQFVR